MQPLHRLVEIALPPPAAARRWRRRCARGSGLVVLAGRPSTQPVTRSLWPGWPMPMRRRWNLPWPSCGWCRAGRSGRRGRRRTSAAPCPAAGPARRAPAGPAPARSSSSAARRPPTCRWQVHEGGRLEQPDRCPPMLDLGGFAEQLDSSPKRAPACARPGRPQTRTRRCAGFGRVRAGVAQPDDEAQVLPCAASRRCARPHLRGMARAITSSSSSWRPWRPALRPRPSAALGLFRACLAMTTARSWSLPSFSAGQLTPAGSLSCDRWMMSPTFSSARSTSMNSGRSRQAGDVRLRSARG
jgi:hypothetical protein